MKTPVIYFHVGDPNNEKEINDIKDTISVLEANVSANFIFVRTPQELIKTLISEDITTESALIVFRTGHCILNNISIEEKFDIIASVHHFVADKVKVRVAPIIYAPMPKSFINDLKQHNIVGLIPASQKFNIEETIKAYNALLAGEEYYTDIVIQSETRTAAKHSQSTIKLTTRQSQILDLISHRGLSNKKIAQHLKISESTVKVHMSAILKAYGVRNRTQLALAGGRGLTA